MAIKNATKDRTDSKNGATAIGVELFVAGLHKDSAGNVKNWPVSRLQEAANAYNESVTAGLHEAPALKAPVQVGHNAHVAYGWVGEARVEGDRLLVDYRQVNNEFAELVNEGVLKKRSVAFYAPDDANNPTPGRWNLRHVAHVGVPAVKGLADFEFDDSNDSAIVYEFAEDDTSANTVENIASYEFGDGMAYKVGDTCSMKDGRKKRYGKISRIHGDEEDPDFDLEMEGGEPAETVVVKSSQIMADDREKPSKKGKKTKTSSAYSESGGESNAFMDGWELRPIATMFGKLRDYLVEQVGAEAAEKIISQAEVTGFAESAGRDTARSPSVGMDDYWRLSSRVDDIWGMLRTIVNSLASGDSGAMSNLVDQFEEQTMGEETVTTAATATATATEAATPAATNAFSVKESPEYQALEAQNAALSQRLDAMEKSRADEFAESDRRSVEAFVDGLIAQRKCYPKDKAARVATLMAIDATASYAFGEGTQSVRATVMAQMSQGGELWSNGRLPTGPGDAPGDDNAFADCIIPSLADAQGWDQVAACRAKAKELGYNLLDPNQFEEGMGRAMVALGVQV